MPKAVRLCSFPFLAAVCVVASAATSAAAQAPPGSAPEALADARSLGDLAATARQLPLGGRLFVSGVGLAAGAPAEALELVRFEVWAPRAKIVVHGAGGETTLPAPRDNAYFRGRVAGDLDSLAVLSVLGSGEVRGIVQRADGIWTLGGARGKGPAMLAAREVDAATAGAERFACAEGELPAALSPASLVAGSAAGSATAAFTSTEYTARVALESDWEFYQKFGSTTAAADYVGDLFAYSSAIYDQEISTDLQVTYLSLWTTSADPWSQSSPSCALYEFGRWWNDNRGGVDRTIAHFLSGKNNGGGVAWLGVLCNGSFNVNLGSSCGGLSPQIDNYGGAYGYTGDLDGNFDPGNPQVVWDIVATSHEIGHNFNSPHTHCYNGLGGSSQPVDQCYSGEPGCYSGATSLPCPAGNSGCGTIMSYCHLRSGGFNNISLTFGTGHPWGVLPQRVPDRMRTHVEAVASFAPSCLARIGGCRALTVSHTGSGSDPVATPDRSDGCTAGSFVAGEGIALRAEGDPGWGLASWTGTDDDGYLGYVNALTMPDADHAVSVVYESGCNDLTLSSGTETGTVTHDVCGTLTAGTAYQVAAPGDVTLRAGKRVVLTDGFAVGAGAVLRVETSP